jgi:GNAT superfamily N-acetyltransferase
LERVLCDPNFDPAGALIAEDHEGTIQGFLLSLVRLTPLSGTDLEAEQGWITTFFAVPEARRRGVGSSLLGAAEAFFALRGRKRIDFAPYAPNYFLPGLDAQAYPKGLKLLEGHGFHTHYTAVAMARNLLGFVYPDEVRELEQARVAAGYRFGPLEPRYAAEAIRFAGERFNPDWGRALREGILRGIPLEQVLVSIHPRGHVVGFCMFGGYDGVAERFGPFGVDGFERGKGLGKILLYKCMSAIRRQGLHNLWFLWTDEASPAGKLYASAGFTPSRKFHIMRKELA